MLFHEKKNPVWGKDQNIINFFWINKGPGCWYIHSLQSSQDLEAVSQFPCYDRNLNIVSYATPTFPLP